MLIKSKTCRQRSNTKKEVLTFMNIVFLFNKDKQTLKGKKIKIFFIEKVVK